jgi:hypothetical protein
MTKPSPPQEAMEHVIPETVRPLCLIRQALCQRRGFFLFKEYQQGAEYTEEKPKMSG